MEAERTESAEILPLDRYIRAVSICNNLALLASQGTMVQFLQRVAILTRLQRYWTKGYDTVQISCADATEADDDDGADDLDPGAASLVPVTGPEDWDARSDSTVDLKPDVSSMAVEQSVSDSGASDLDQDDADYTPVPKKEPAADRKKKFACSECGETFRFRTMLKRHEATKHQAPTSDVAATPTAAEDVTAEATKTSKEEPGLSEENGSSDSRDQLSPQKFSSNSEPLSHKNHRNVSSGSTPQQRDSNREPFLCLRCNRSFGTEALWKRHVDLHEHCDKLMEKSASERFPCQHCPRTFNSLVILSKHEHSHKRNKLRKRALPYRCPECSEAFRTARGLATHKCVDDAKPEAAKSNNAFYCQQCEKSYETKHRLQAHMGYHRRLDKRNMNGKRFSCARCSQTFRTENVYLKHKALHRRFDGQLSNPSDQSSSAMLSCSRCPRTFDCRFMLARHEENHRTNDQRIVRRSNAFRCQQCPASYVKKEMLEEHEKSHEREVDDDLPQHICKICDKGFRFPNVLWRHMESVHTREDCRTVSEVFVCAICDQFFMSEPRLKLHEISQHSAVFDREDNDSAQATTIKEPAMYTCNQCGRKLKSEDTLAMHLRTHTGEKPYVCRVAGCERRFAQTSTRAFHERTHSDYTPHVCTECGRGFKHRALLNIHARTHSGVRPHECRVCHKRFSKSDGLSCHMRTHTGERPCACIYCPKQFRSMTQLRRHENALHKRDRLWYCNVCNKEFTQPANLRTHMRTHTGEKPFRCTVCDMRFAHSGTLKGHLRTHEQIAPDPLLLTP